MLFCYPLHFIHRLPKYKAFGKQKVCCKFVTNVCNKYRNRMQISFLQSVCGKVATSSKIVCKSVSGKLFAASLQINSTMSNLKILQHKKISYI